MRIEVIKRLFPVGSSVTVTSETLGKVSGVLTEIGDDYIVLGQESALESDAIQKIEKDNSTPSPLPDPDPDPPNFNRASEKLSEIEKRFETEIQTTKIELKIPDFTFPVDTHELRGLQENSKIHRLWEQTMNAYKYAQKTNELSPKFGRIQNIVQNTELLTTGFPDSSKLKRALAYFYSISDKWDEVLYNYQKSAVQSKEVDDWFGVAVSALKLNKEDLACYSLEKFFYNVSTIDARQAWPVYVNLVKKFNNLPAFCKQCKIDKYEITEEEIKVLLETAIYLLKQTGAEAVAVEIIRQGLIGESPQSLLDEACQKLDGEPVESYRQFLATFREDEIREKKKPDPIRVQPVIPTPSKRKKRTNSSKKQKTQTQVRQTGGALYYKAQQAKIDKHLETAEKLFRECIRRNLRIAGSIMNLAEVLVRLDRAEEAVTLLETNSNKAEDKQSWDHLLINVYQNAGQYGKAIPLLNNTLKRPQSNERRAQIRWQIANAYIKSEDYASAERQFHQLQKLRPDNITVQRNLAFCLLKQEHYDEAEEILNRIRNTSPDAKTVELLEAIESARETGEFMLDEDRIISGELHELSEFAKFFLGRCTFENIQPERVNEEGKYTGSAEDVGFDKNRLDNIIREQGTRRPRPRSNSYLTVARIYYDRQDYQNTLYRYLCRSFSTRGDAAALEGTHLDTVREWYCEALRVYSGMQDQNHDEPYAVNALARFLFSYHHDREKILTSPPRQYENSLPQQLQFIGNTVEVVISDHPQKDKVFDAIGYLLRCRYAGNRILKCIYNTPELRGAALEYLQKKEINIPDSIDFLDDFVDLWQQLWDMNFNEARIISPDLRFLNNFKLTTAWLENSIKHVQDIQLKPFFELDQRRVGELQKILENALELCKQVTFEERERLCLHLINTLCQDLLREIEESPTRLSVEDVYPIVEIIQERVNIYLKELYETSKPQLALRLPLESYVPDPDLKIKVQIAIENESGRSPAESLELVIQDDEVSFAVTEPHIRRNESLRGGEQSILTVPLSVTPEAVQAQTFSLSVLARYRTRTEEQEQTPVQNLSIRLPSENEFERISNPYSYTRVVSDENMFVGREELIQNIADSIQESHTQNKCVLIYGQKRSGKSSVLYHLNKLLQKEEDLLILNMGNIASSLDEDSKVPIQYVFLGRILNRLKAAIQRRVKRGASSLNLSIPDAQVFYDYPTPVPLFKDTFEEFTELVSNQADWCGVQVLLLIDEFQYIYGRINAGKLPETFMETWKELVEANYFNAVLVGQDVMPKFKLEYSNEFGITQDERVTYLKPDDARRLIDEPIRIGGRQGESRYREQAVQRILDLTARSPYYIQMICQRLVDYMNNKRAKLVTEADVDQVKNELIDGSNPLNQEMFDNLINSGDTSADAISDEDTLKILKAIADNSKTGPCRRDSIVCKTSSLVDTILDDLEKRDVIERREQSYKIQVELFKEWLIVNG